MASSTSTTFDVDVEEHPASSETDQELVRRASEDTVYGRKCALVNRCFQEEIGFGRYQIELFLLTGLGWMADNIWLQGVAVVLVQVQQEFKPSRVEFATLALYVGLILGASVWGTLADMIGRKVSYNVTLLIAGVFGIAAGGAPNFVTFAALVAYLLRSLTCLVFVFRFFVFDLQESSKYLLARGRDEEALEVVHPVLLDYPRHDRYYQVLQHISRRNGRTISLTVAELKAVEEKAGRTKDVGRRSLKPSLSHLKPLFNGRRLAINTTMTILLWGLIGLAYPLFNAFLPLYLADRLSDSDSSTGTTYRNYTIISVLGIVGPGIACLFVDWTRSNANIDHNVKHADSEPTRKFALVGRKLVMALSTLLTGVFLFLFTTSKTDAAVLGFSCASALTANAMYAVLYAYTPEVFPAPHRGTGDAVCSAFNRIAGVLAPVIKIATTSREGGATGMAANLPVFISASLLVVAAVLMAFLPIETSGRAAL
ncbi:MFS general substrate transporter [Schizophyllum commune H4-8]|uniref:MFS general substrate transporter n=1 Tax=Schizophyllum commune (strain H4-8 / FGSC 9210) TaxID=578458 RepID=UPI00215ED371|nr:MFS general substrate transporter [Schizophyllum commune H4-8]KAI5888957.1 MFS general substrate transporter [Schizophyllum commune H4-8]